MIHYPDPNRFVKNEIASDKEESLTKSYRKALASVARPFLFPGSKPCNTVYTKVFQSDRWLCKDMHRCCEFRKHL